MTPDGIGAQSKLGKSTARQLRYSLRKLRIAQSSVRRCGLSPGAARLSDPIGHPMPFRAVDWGGVGQQKQLDVRWVRGAALALVLLVLAGAGAPAASGASGSRWINCGRVVLSDAPYSLTQTKSTCRRARQVVLHFDHQVAAGTREEVPGGQNLVDSQLPFKVYDWRCGGVEGHILCERGHWRSSTPPPGRAELDAVLRPYPTVMTGGTPVFQVRPATIIFAMSLIVGGPDATSPRHPGHLRWTTYNDHQGIAVGTVWINDCTPDCAHGSFSPHRIKIHVFEVRNRHFRLLTVRYRYRGRNNIGRFAASHSRGFNGPGSGFWFYAICGVTPGVHC